MKIACVIGAFSYGGAERVMTNLVNYFCENNEVSFIAIVKRQEVAYKIDSKVKVFNGIGNDNKIKAVAKLKQIISREKPDVVISFLTQINVLCIMALMGMKIPLIVSERNDPRWTCGNLMKILRFFLYPLADGFVFQTDDVAKYFAKNIRNRSAIIPNPIYISDDDLKYRPVRRNHEIVMACRLDKQKNIDLAIRAIGKLKPEFSAIKLVIYGEGPEKKHIERLIESLDLEGNVELKGTSNQLHKDIRDSSIFLLTSDFEGMPNALMEAMALGLCCVSTDCPAGGPKMLIKDDENGLLFKVGDLDGLEEKIRFIMACPETTRKIGEEARKIYSIYNPEHIYKLWDEYIEKVIMEAH